MTQTVPEPHNCVYISEVIASAFLSRKTILNVCFDIQDDDYISTTLTCRHAIPAHSHTGLSLRRYCTFSTAILYLNRSVHIRIVSLRRFHASSPSARFIHSCAFTLLLYDYSFTLFTRRLCSFEHLRCHESTQVSAMPSLNRLWYFWGTLFTSQATCGIPQSYQSL